jgi:hypothetical protein
LCDQVRVTALPPASWPPLATGALALGAVELADVLAELADGADDVGVLAVFLELEQPATARAATATTAVPRAT